MQLILEFQNSFGKYHPVCLKSLKGDFYFLILSRIPNIIKCPGHQRALLFLKTCQTFDIHKFLWTTLILVIVCCCFLFHSSSKKSKLKWKVVILNFCVVLKLSWIFSVSHFFKRSKIKDSGPLFVLILPVCWNAPLKIYVLDLLIYT